MNDAQRTPTVQQVEELRVAAQGHMDAGNLTTVTYLENAADTIETLTKRLASSYDNEIALTEENEKLRRALDAVDEIVKVGNWQPASFVRERIAEAVSGGR